MEWGYALADKPREVWVELKDAFMKVSTLSGILRIQNMEAEMPFDNHWLLPRETGTRQCLRTVCPIPEWTSCGTR